MTDPLAKFLGTLSIIGGGLTTLKAATIAKLSPAPLVGSVDPQAAMAWVQVVAASIPAIGGALVLLYAKWIETSRKANGGDAALQAKIAALTAERDQLAAKLNAAEKSKPGKAVE